MKLFLYKKSVNHLLINEKTCVGWDFCKTLYRKSTLYLYFFNALCGIMWIGLGVWLLCWIFISFLKLFVLFRKYFK